jgi:hypothetical protein
MGPNVAHGMHCHRLRYDGTVINQSFIGNVGRLGAGGVIDRSDVIEAMFETRIPIQLHLHNDIHSQFPFGSQWERMT